MTIVPPHLAPVEFYRAHWPHSKLYDKEVEILESIRDNFITVVHAGNMLGKDFTAGRAAIWFFMSRHPVRIVTTSVDGTQLEGVLWGEIRRAIEESVIPLSYERGGPIIDQHLHLKKLIGHGKNQRECGVSYCIGRVARKGEGMLGHHAYPDNWDGVTPHTLLIADEASGVEDISWERGMTWAKRMLAIGNPWDCNNFFKKLVQRGNVRAA